MKWEKFIQSGFRMPFYMHLYFEGGIKDNPKNIGWGYSNGLITIEKQINTVYHDLIVYQDFQQFLAKNIENNDFRKKLISTIKHADKVLLEYCNQLYHHDYNLDSATTLKIKLEKFTQLFRTKFGLYGIPKFIDIAIVGLLPKLLSRELTENQLFVLTKSSELSLYTQEQISIYQIASKIVELNLVDLFKKSNAEILDQLGRSYPKLFWEIESYANEFNWVPVSHHVLPLNIDQAIVNIQNILADKGSIAGNINKLTTEPAKTKLEQEKLTKELKLPNKDLEIISFLRELNAVNDSRKAAMSQSILWSYPLFQAIARKLKIDVVSLRQLMAIEISNSLDDGKLSSQNQTKINNRLNAFVCKIESGKIVTLSGDDAKKVIIQELGINDYSALNELKGMIAHPGKVTGKVRLIITEHQVENLKQGEILVSSMTNPDMVTAMKKAGAIVTDEGGITCHAAIVARELGKPCIIGTKVATKVFKGGDMVEVDATVGTVKKLSSS